MNLIHLITTTEFLAAVANFSSSNTTRPERVVYPMLKQPPRSGMDLLLYIFNLSWYLYSCPSVRKSYFHSQDGKTPSFRPISLTSYVSKLLDRMILSHLLFLLESKSFLSPRYARFCHGWCTLDQILFFLSLFNTGLTNASVERHAFVVFQNHASRSFRARPTWSARIHSWPCSLHP